MLCLLDADVVNYRVGFTTQDIEDWPIVKYRLDEMIDRILVETNATEYKLFLSDNKENNFRYQVWPDYKANRVQPKPKWHEQIKEYLIKEWDAQIAYGQEADDCCGIYQDKETYTSVIASIDKDLLQIVGNHYNFVKQIASFVTPEEGLRSLYSQFMVGDSGDNIKGCHGIGPVKAEKILGKATTEGEMFDLVVQTYQLQHKDWSLQQIAEHLQIIGILLKIKTTEEEENWRFPESSQMTAKLKSLCTQPKAVESSQSTEHTGAGKSMDGSSPLGQQMGIDSSLKPTQV